MAKAQKRKGSKGKTNPKKAGKVRKAKGTGKKAKESIARKKGASGKAKKKEKRKSKGKVKKLERKEEKAKKQKSREERRKKAKSIKEKLARKSESKSKRRGGKVRGKGKGKGGKEKGKGKGEVKKKKVEEEEIVIIKIGAKEDEEEGGKVEKLVIEIDEDKEKQKEEKARKGEQEHELELEGKVPEIPEPQIQEPQKPVRRGPRCPECGSTNLVWDYERGELVCMDCGAVIEESMIDFGPEWRAFDSYQKARRQRTGSPIKYTKPNKGLVTEIDKYNRDIRGSKLSPQAASQMGRLRKWHKRSSIASSIERNLTIAMGDLERIASYLGLPPNIRESAALLYRKAVEKGLIRGRLIESVVAAVIYMICRQYGIPRTLDEISEISGIPKKEIGRTYRFLKKELYVDVPLTNPIYYVPRFASALGLSGRVQEKAKEILQEAVNRGLISGRGPTGVAAAAVYIASVMMGERKTQKEVAEVAGVTEVTIRNRYRELKRELDLDIDDEDL